METFKFTSPKFEGREAGAKKMEKRCFFFGRFLTTPRSHQKKDTSSLREGISLVLCNVIII